MTRQRSLWHRSPDLCSRRASGASPGVHNLTLLLLTTLALCATAGAPELPFPTMPPLNRLVFGGDVMMSRFVGTLAHENNDPAGPLRDIAGVFSSADIAFVNLESPFSDEGKPTTKGMVFKAAPDMIEALKVARIHIVSTANNHARDCGSYGVGFTLDLLAQNKIAAVGSAASGEEVHQGKVLERHGVRYGFLAYTYNQSNGNYKDTDERIAMLDPEQVRKDVAALAPRCDVVIVSMHAGTEYMPKPNEDQKRFAHAAIDAGARIVIGHHPHVIQPVEEYGGGVIFYSLGNLVFDQFQRKETQVGRVVEAFFLGRILVKYNLIPVDIVRTVPRVHVEPPPGTKPVLAQRTKRRTRAGATSVAKPQVPKPVAQTP
jgi:poly-gamma-glutamate capsule biosynthesis protein CapA/YwtB (metallophosphatase superfamily)